MHPEQLQRPDRSKKSTKLQVTIQKNSTGQRLRVSPRLSQECYRHAQECPRSPRASKTHPRAPENLRERPKSNQDAPKTAQKFPRRPQDRPSCLQEPRRLPERLQDGPKSARRVYIQEGPLIIQDGTCCLDRCPASSFSTSPQQLLHLSLAAPVPPLPRVRNSRRNKPPE